LGVKWGAASSARRKNAAAAAALPGKCVLPAGNPDAKRKMHLVVKYL